MFRNPLAGADAETTVCGSELNWPDMLNHRVVPPVGDQNWAKPRPVGRQGHCPTKTALGSVNVLGLGREPPQDLFRYFDSSPEVIRMVVMMYVR